MYDLYAVVQRTETMSNSQTKFYTIQIERNHSVIFASEISVGFVAESVYERARIGMDCVWHLVQLLCLKGYRRIPRKGSFFLCNLAKLSLCCSNTECFIFIQNC